MSPTSARGGGAASWISLTLTAKLMSPETIATGEAAEAHTLLIRPTQIRLFEGRMAITPIGRGVLGAGTTMVARRLMRRAMHNPNGAPRVPAAVRRNNSLPVALLLAAAAGALLALADVLQEQRKRATQVA